MTSHQFCIRKCINGCLVSKGIHYKAVGKDTKPWTEEEVIMIASMDEDEYPYYAKDFWYEQKFGDTS